MTETNKLRLYAQLISLCFGALKSSALSPDSTLRLRNGSCDHVINPQNALWNAISHVVWALNDMNKSISLSEKKDIHTASWWDNLIHLENVQSIQFDECIHQSGLISKSIKM